MSVNKSTTVTHEDLFPDFFIYISSFLSVADNYLKENPQNSGSKHDEEREILVIVSKTRNQLTGTELKAEERCRVQREKREFEQRDRERNVARIRRKKK